jgi:hypothetical protein
VITIALLLFSTLINLELSFAVKSYREEIRELKADLELFILADTYNRS